MLQLLLGPLVAPKSKILWVNAIKALFLELWLERNQRIFHDMHLDWLDRFESACLKVSSWCSLSKPFVNCTIQDICLKWKTFIFPL